MNTPHTIHGVLKLMREDREQIARVESPLLPEAQAVENLVAEHETAIRAVIARNRYTLAQAANWFLIEYGDELPPAVLPSIVYTALDPLFL